MQRLRQPSRSWGFSLVELMVALAIGAILLLTLSRVFVDIKSHSVRDTQLSRMQENARVATAVLTRVIRETRSMPCRGLTLHERASSLRIKACALLPDRDGQSCRMGRPGDHLLSSHRALGYDNRRGLNDPQAYEDLPASGRDNLAEHWLRGDVLVTWSAVAPPARLLEGGSARLTGAGLDTTADLPVTDLPNAMVPGQPVVLSDCVGADVFAISGPDDLDARGSILLGHGRQGVDGETVNATADLGRAYNWMPDASTPMASFPGDPAALWPLRYQAHYVCCVDMDQGRLLSDGSVNNCRPSDPDYGSQRYRPSLCRWSLASNRSVPLINEVADLRLRFFGVDAVGGFGPGTDRPQSSPDWMTQQQAWPGTRGVFVELLLTTRAEQLDQRQASPSDTDWPPDDVGVQPDRLGAGLPADERLYRRVAFSAALRTAVPYVLERDVLEQASSADADGDASDRVASDPELRTLSSGDA